ncbi:MAG: mitochondrial fission ELM1 family protein [Hyphomonadaceae bacterium]|nr:mitochondrial fission ELM1 family protein [Hyphomonadaceae bacterium]
MRSAGYQPAEPLNVWIVTDGRAGIEAQALGLAEAIARRAPVSLTTKRVHLRTPWSWLPPGFIPAAQDTLTLESDPIKPPWPDIFIGCGRASVPFALGVRTWSNSKTFVVQLQDPRVNPREFDVVIPPLHDGLEGQNVLPIVGACNRITPERLDDAVLQYQSANLEDLPSPRFAVLIGGKSKRQNISATRAREISDSLAAVQRETGGSLLVTLSRRTGLAARMQFRTWLAPHSAVFYEDEGANPYPAILGAADHIFVTADSVNMATEASATGRPVHILAVDGHAGKLARFHQSLARRGCARPFKGRLEAWSYPPLLETDRAAAAVLTAWAARTRPS